MSEVVIEIDGGDTSTMPNYNYTGQRADKIRVTRVANRENVDEESMVKEGRIVKEIEHYTIDCDECGDDGYYDERGDVICENCGIVLTGDKDAMMPSDHSGSRGITEDTQPETGRKGHRGSSEPRI